MEKALEIQRKVCEILGTEDVYLVGGSVRDIVMGNEPKDYDFTTPMLPDDIETAVKKAGRRAYTVGKDFGTVGFKVELIEKPNHLSTIGDKLIKKFEYVEVTTFRSEIYTNKSRKPEVNFVASLNEDLARRDFTMNAMVLRPDGRIYDPYGGKLDIHDKKIVTVGFPKDRIQEDPLRMLRAARFAARYGFEIDPNFIGKARQLSDRIYDVSVERWVMELDKLITSDNPVIGLTYLDTMGLMESMLPEVRVSDIPGGTTFGADVDSAWEQLLSYSHKRSRTASYINKGISARLKFSNTRTKIVTHNS